tara:strand:+ start:1122 stop:1421 length:300 start_codon:yes stop_codon:yes gene_type:complete
MLTDSYMANEETFPTCGYYLYDTVQDDTFQLKKKSKLEILLLTLLSPIYIIGLLIYGIFTFVQFLTQGGFFGLLIFGWIISIIYHFLFTFLPFLFNVVV